MKDYVDLVVRDRYDRIDQMLDEREQFEIVRRGLRNVDDVLDGES